MRGLIRLIALLFCRGWVQRTVDRWRDAVSSGFPTFASDDLDLYPFSMILDFPFRAAYYSLNCLVLKKLRLIVGEEINR